MGFFQFRGQLAEFVRGASHQHEVVAFTREDAREFQADAEGCAGDESGFSVGHGTRSLCQQLRVQSTVGDELYSAGRGGGPVTTQTTFTPNFYTKAGSTS